MASSIQQQTQSLRQMAQTKPYHKKLVGLEYTVLSRVYGGGADTEVLCDCLDVRKGEDVLDVGTGTGVVALFMKQRGARRVVAVDFAPDAVRNAKLNSTRLGLPIVVKRSNAFSAVTGRFDVITFNPPYTDRPAQQQYQICFWDQGHTSVRKFFAGLRRHAKPRSRVFVCWSSFGTRGLLAGLAKAHDMRLRRVGKRKGNHGFSYYVYRILMRNLR